VPTKENVLPINKFIIKAIQKLFLPSH